MMAHQARLVQPEMLADQECLVVQDSQDLLATTELVEEVSLEVQAHKALLDQRDSQEGMATREWMEHLVLKAHRVQPATLDLREEMDNQASQEVPACLATMLRTALARHVQQSSFLASLIKVASSFVLGVAKLRDLFREKNKVLCTPNLF